jgi:hypothetical protein
MKCETWSPTTSATNPPLHILVAVESTNWTEFKNFIRILVRDGRLARIIIDEAHLVLTHASFRDIMHLLQWLGQQSVQIVLQSASIPPRLEPALCAKFALTNYVSCRGETCRSNISYNVIHTHSVTATLDKMVRAALAGSEDAKVMIYCRSQAAAEATAARLSIGLCHGNMTSEEVNKVLGRLRAGEIRAIASTTILGAALDVPEVSHVFHEDYPYDVISFAQESGRCGRRNGDKGYSYVIVETGARNPNGAEQRPFGGDLIYAWANDDVICRRWFMQVYNDGFGRPCSMMTGTSHLCDNCNIQVGDVPLRGEGSRFDMSQIEKYLPTLGKPLFCSFFVI